jgi:flagellar protein FlaG
MISNSIPAATVTTTATPTAASKTRGESAATERVRQDMPAGGKSSPVEQPHDANLQRARRVADALAKYLTDLANELQFRIDDATGNPVMTVYNTQTKTVVRQVPSEEVLAVSRYLQQEIDRQHADQLLNTRVK